MAELQSRTQSERDQVKTTNPGWCRACGAAAVKDVLALGDMPPVNAFLNEDELVRERAYPLDLVYCRACSMVQLKQIVPPQELFANYLHLSSASQSNVQHLSEVADVIRQRIGLHNSTGILDVGSNDGRLLSEFLGGAGKLLGVDPAQNLLEYSRALGVETIPDFLTLEVAERIRASHGQFDVILALNVVAHTPDVMQLLNSIRGLLAPGGTLVIEAAYVLETILRGEFDTIYHEHVYCFSLHALSAALKRAGLLVVDVEKITQQGGSLRVIAQGDNESPKISRSVKKLLDEEEANGLTDAKVYGSVVDKVNRFTQEVNDLLRTVRQKYGDVVGLGAPARGVVILNKCKIGTSDMAYVIDDTPIKQGKFVPGVHIPVTSWEKLHEDKPKAFFMLSWNYRREIMDKLHRFVDEGVVIVPFPKLTLLHFGPGKA